MAKWGEGDPRWIVEERADATNVNNWHWTEKNATPWSKDRLKYLLVGQKIDEGEYSCEIIELSKCEGEASANNRKAKLIFFYEFDIKGEWKGTKVGNDNVIRGKFEVPNLSEENDADDLEIVITTDSNTIESQQMKDFMHKKGSLRIRAQLGEYMTDLKKEFSQGMILPTSNAKTNNAKLKNAKENEAKKHLNQTVVNIHQPSGGVQIECKDLHMTVEFMCQAADIYRALTERDMVLAFTRSEGEIEAEKGGRFRLFGGNIHGEFTQMDLNEKICMRWRAKTWPVEHYSHVTIELKQKDCTTDIVLTQTAIPENEFDRTKEGWHQYYWEPIKMTFGFGARLF